MQASLTGLGKNLQLFAPVLHCLWYYLIYISVCTTQCSIFCRSQRFMSNLSLPFSHALKPVVSPVLNYLRWHTKNSSLGIMPTKVLNTCYVLLLAKLSQPIIVVTRSLGCVHFLTLRNLHNVLHELANIRQDKTMVRMDAGTSASISVSLYKLITKLNFNITFWSISDSSCITYLYNELPHLLCQSLANTVCYCI